MDRGDRKESTIYITHGHGHGDHFFGLNPILNAFPEARAVTAAAVVPDDPAAILGGTKTYIRDFEQALAESHSAQALVDKMMARYGDLGNPYTLWTAAQAVFEQGQGASS